MCHCTSDAEYTYFMHVCGYVIWIYLCNTIFQAYISIFFWYRDTSLHDWILIKAFAVTCENSKKNVMRAHSLLFAFNIIDFRAKLSDIISLDRYSFYSIPPSRRSLSLRDRIQSMQFICDDCNAIIIHYKSVQHGHHNVFVCVSIVLRESCADSHSFDRRLLVCVWRKTASFWMRSWKHIFFSECLHAPLSLLLHLPINTKSSSMFSEKKRSIGRSLEDSLAWLG